MTDDVTGAAAVVCRACSSNKVIPDAVVNDHDQVSWRPLSVTVKRATPEAAEFLGIAGTRDTMTVPLHARVCADCGAVDLYAADAAALWAAYRE
jgi:hypothetical protein